MHISELRNFRLLATYENDLKVSIKRDGNWVLLKTFSRDAGTRGRFFIDAEKLSAWMNRNDSTEYWDRDCGHILRITYDRNEYVFLLEMWWLSVGTAGRISGVFQKAKIDCYTFVQATVRTEYTTILVKENNTESTKFIWTESANKVLREIQRNKQMKRALCKAFARGCLNWPGSTITMYSDFSRGSFFFREDKGICGGLILHDGTHGSMGYSVHT